MSDNRRYEDARMDKLESVIETIKDDLSLVKQKIFNGFSHSIKSTEEKVNYIDERNREEHHNLMSKLDKIIFLWVSSSISIVIAVIIYFIKGLLEWNISKRMSILMII